MSAPLFGKMAPSTRRIAAVILVVASAAAVYLLGIRRDMSDFGVCFQAGNRILAGETLYRPTDGHLQFKYAPAAALAYAPFALLPWEAAKAVWYLVMLGCLAWLASVLAGWGRKRARTVHWPLIWTLAVMAKFLGREFELGQVNLLILLLLLLAARDESSGRFGRAGILWGLSLFFKPYGAVFLPYLILKKSWAAVAAGFGALAAGLILPAAVYGFSGNALLLGEWIRTLSASTPGLLRVGDNASLFAFFAKTIGLSDAGAMIAGGMAAVVLAVLLLAFVVRGTKGKIPGSWLADSACLLLMIPMLSPLGWNYNYLYGGAAVFLLVSAWGGFRKGERAGLSANFALIGGTLRETLGKNLFRFYTGKALVVPSFILVFLFLLLGRRRRLF